MFYFMCLTGVRVGELGGLKWCDIDMDKQVIFIRRSLSCSYCNGVKKTSLSLSNVSSDNRLSSSAPRSSMCCICSLICITSSFSYCGRRLTLTSWGNAYRCGQAAISGIAECKTIHVDKEQLENTVLSCTRIMASMVGSVLPRLSVLVCCFLFPRSGWRHFHTF